MYKYQKREKNWIAIAVIIAAIIIVAGFICYFEFKENKAEEKAKNYFEEIDRRHEENRVINEQREKKLFKSWEKQDKELFERMKSGG